MPYEAERVEALKKQLVAALTNASNMKGVKPEEYVTVTVFGSPAAMNGEATRERRSSSSNSSSFKQCEQRGPRRSPLAWRQWSNGTKSYSLTTRGHRRTGRCLRCD